MISIVIRTHSYKIPKRDKEKMLVILFNPGEALNQALQTVGKSRKNLNIPETRFCIYVLESEPEEEQQQVGILEPCRGGVQGAGRPPGLLTVLNDKLLRSG